MNTTKYEESKEIFLSLLWRHWAARIATIIVVVGLACSAVSLWYAASHLEFLTGRNDLISTQKRYLQLDEAYAKTFHGLDHAVVVAESPTLGDTKAFVRQLGERLQSDTAHVQTVLYRIDLSSLDGKKLLLLSPAELRQLRTHVEDAQEVIRALVAAPGLNTLLTAINQEVSTALASHLASGFLGGPAAERSSENKPLNLGFLQLLLRHLDNAVRTDTSLQRSPWTEFFGNDVFDSEGFFVSADQRLVTLLVEPRTHGDGFAAQQDAINALRAHIAELRRTFPYVEAGVTGDVVLGNDEMIAAQADTGTATFLSLIGVTLLYMLFFHSVRRPLLIALSVMIGLSWTVGFLTLTVGHVSVLSIFVAPILIGLCDAYGVYFVTRYEEERDLGTPLRAALRATFVSTAPSLLAGATTTALAFYAMILADFRGVQELGFIAGSGIFLLLLAALTVLPALLILTEHETEWRRPRRRATLLARSFAYWGGLIHRRRRAVLLLTALASLICLLAVPTLTFDYNLLHLQAHGTESVIWELRLLDHVGPSSRFALAAVPSLVEVTQKAARFAALPSVDHVETITSLVPTDQEARLALVRGLAPFFAELPTTLGAPSPVDVEDLRRTLEALRFKLRSDNADWDSTTKPAEQELATVRVLLTRVLLHLTPLPNLQATDALERLQHTLFQDFARQWSLLQQNLHPSGPITLADIPAPLRTRFVSADGSQFLLQIYPRHNIWEGAPLREFVDQLRSVDPDVTGNPVIAYESIRTMTEGYLYGGLYAALAIPVVTFVVLRRIGDTLRALCPVLCGALWTAGVMWLLNLQFNVANLVVIPLLIGVGVDGGINLIRRAREDNLPGWTVIGGSTGQAIALYSLDSIAGFGSLLVARHAGVFSMGLLLTIAVGSVLLATFILLPLVVNRLLLLQRDLTEEAGTAGTATNRHMPCASSRSTVS